MQYLFTTEKVSPPVVEYSFFVVKIGFGSVAGVTNNKNHAFFFLFFVFAFIN